MMDQEDWMNLQEFRPLAEAGVPWSEIARLAGCDPRTAKKYLSQRPRPPRYGPRPSAGKLVDRYVGTIDAWLRASKGALCASTIFERLAGEPYRFPGSYERVKEYVRLRRPQILAELGIVDRGAQMHRRFEVAPGSQAQVDWGEERGPLIGTPVVYSFHMTLSYSRDTFCCYTDRTDIATFFGCHVRAFEYFGGVPETIVYDRTKTVVRRHVRPRAPVPLHPEAVAFAGHYGFGIDVLAAYRPTGKGRVEKAVEIVREHVLAGRAFYSLQEMDAAFLHWAPLRAAQVHRTHGEVIGDRAARDRAALRPLPAQPYLVAEQHLRRIGKDCLVSFESSMYSVPARLVRPFQRVHVRAGDTLVTICALPADGGGLLAVHARARKRGSWVVDEAHWDGLPDGHTRAVTAGGDGTGPRQGRNRDEVPGGLGMLLAAHPQAAAPVARRPLSDYEPGTPA